MDPWSIYLSDEMAYRCDREFKKHTSFQLMLQASRGMNTMTHLAVLCAISDFYSHPIPVLLALSEA